MFRTRDVHLLVMTPKKRDLSSHMIRMPRDLDVVVHVLEPVLGMTARHAHRLGDLLQKPDEADRASLISLSCLRMDPTSVPSQSGTLLSIRSRSTTYLVNDDIDLDPLLRLPLQQPIQPILGMLSRRPPQVKLGRKPPVEDHDRCVGLFEHDGNGPEEVVAVDVGTNDGVARLGREGVEPMAVAEGLVLAVDFLRM
jgi:hypothetical protein